jgi:hypothetical protein
MRKKVERASVRNDLSLRAETKRSTVTWGWLDWVAVVIEGQAWVPVTVDLGPIIFVPTHSTSMETNHVCGSDFEVVNKWIFSQKGCSTNCTTRPRRPLQVATAGGERR